MKLKPISSRERRHNEAKTHNRVYLKRKEFETLFKECREHELLTKREIVAIILGIKYCESVLDRQIVFLRERLNDFKTTARGL